MFHDSIRWAKRPAVLILLIILTAVLILPLAADGAESSETVRVGWYESPFNTVDGSGRRSGYAYEYQLKVAAYTGWSYSYVSGGWSDLLQMLIDGEIDVMSDVSYTEERAEKMLFTDLPMGTEEYCIYIAPGNTEITSLDYSTLNGKRIGVNRGSVQIDDYKKWAERHDVDAVRVELSCTEVESVDMRASGELDAYITLNAYGDPERLIPVCKIGSSDFYFAVNKSRPDLLGELNAALSRIQDENPYYNQRMFEKHVRRFGTNAFLTEAESAWLNGHGSIRVGYQDNYLAFCSADPETGELTGALKDYLEYASTCLANAEISFEPIAFPTAEAALDALKKGEVDCVFPANLSPCDGETDDLLMTPALMSTDVYAVVRQADKNIFANKDHIIVAVNEGNPNYDAFLIDNYPSWRKIYYKDTNECLKAVSDGVADCVLISNYRFNNISRQCDRYHMTTYSTGIELDYCFAVAEGQNELYSILAKITGLVPTFTINAALSYYVAEDAKLTVGDFIAKNIGIFLVIVVAVILLIFALLIRSMHSTRRFKTLIRKTETDDLTGLYNRDYFFEYANRIYREDPDLPRDAIVINIEQFHSVNALNGRDFGDRILRFLGNEIGSVAKENRGIGGRFGADRFDIYCRHTDDYHEILDRLQSKLESFAPNASIRLRMGVKTWEEKIEPVQLFDRARTACSMARQSHTEHLIVFDDKIHERELFEQRLLNDLHRALNSFEFEVYYQPIYDISSEEPKLAGAEALVRWQHPELGMLAPDSFIPLFERNGKIGDVDKYVWAETAKQIARWKEQFGMIIPISVNVSRVDVFDPKLESTLDAILSREGLDHDVIRLEITETAYTENADHLVRVVEKLRKDGYSVAMDDFGSGYSSLNMLSAMPVDVLKMDRTFVRDIENSQKNSQLVALILGIAKNLDVPVIAEGVESESQLRMLKKLGCTLVQGYCFARPMHYSSFESQILREGNQ